MLEPEPMPTRWESVKHLAEGLQPYQGDLFDLFDGAEHVIKAALCWGHLALRLVMMALFPITILVLYPFARMKQKRLHAEKMAEYQRREALIARIEGNRL